MMVRFTFLSFCVFCATAFATHGQALRIGARVLPQINGLYNAQDLSNKDYISSNLTVGFSGGLAISYQIAKQWGVEVDFLYALQGQSYNGNSSLVTQTLPNGSTQTVVNSYLNFRLPTPNLNTGQSATYNIAMSLVKVPILAAYNSTNTTGPVFRAFAGPQVAFLFDVQERISFTNQGVSGQNGQRVDTRETKVVDYSGTGFNSGADRYNGLDISFVLGAGLDFKLTNKLYLNTGLRTEFGLFDIERKGTGSRGGVFWSVPDNSPLPIPTGAARLEDYYGNYYGVGQARTAATRSYAVSLMLGITYVLSNKRNPKDYYW